MLPGELEVGSTPFAGHDVHHGTLHIRGVQKVDAGRYTCVASSPAGTATGTVSLKVGGESELQRARTQSQRHLQIVHKVGFSLAFNRGPIVLRGSSRPDGSDRGECHPPLLSPRFPAANGHLAPPWRQADSHGEPQQDGAAREWTSPNPGWGFHETLSQQSFGLQHCLLCCHFAPDWCDWCFSANVLTILLQLLLFYSLCEVRFCHRETGFPFSFHVS